MLNQCRRDRPAHVDDLASYHCTLNVYTSCRRHADLLTALCSDVSLYIHLMPSMHEMHMRLRMPADPHSIAHRCSGACWVDGRQRSQAISATQAAMVGRCNARCHLDGNGTGVCHSCPGNLCSHTAHTPSEEKTIWQQACTES